MASYLVKVTEDILTVEPSESILEARKSFHLAAPVCHWHAVLILEIFPGVLNIFH